MDRSNFINHIIYSSGQKDSKETHAGAGAIIEILKSVNILSEADGKIVVVQNLSAIINNEPITQTQEDTTSNNDLITQEKNVCQVMA